MNEFIQELRDKEEEAIKQIMVFMSYNPSIGRVLQPGGVDKFQKIILNLVDNLKDVKDPADFDALHDKCVKKIIAVLKTSRGLRVSYGQAQKPVNVYLKLYIDWARRPNSTLRQRILPYLHVPLDRILMATIREKYSDWYKHEIKRRAKKTSQQYSLSKINKRLYYIWQNFFRSEYSRKPLLFDIAWALNR